MTSPGVIPDPCGLKCSPYIIGKLVTTAINEFGAMVTNNIPSRIIAHANWQLCDFQLPLTYDLAYKKDIFRKFQQQNSLAKVKLMSSKHVGIKNWY